MKSQHVKQSVLKIGDGLANCENASLRQPQLEAI